MLEAIENAKKLVHSSAWPRTIDKFPKDTNDNCWGFALDSLKIPALQGLHYHSDFNDLDKKIFDFLQAVGLNPRKLSSVSEKSCDEIVFLFYIFTYFDVYSEDFRGECHVARIELDGTVVEKADNSEEPIVTSLEGIQERLYKERKKTITPILIAVRKPQ